MFAPRIAFVDLETTGARAGDDRITEIGIVEVEDGRVVSEWSSLVDPQVPIPPFIASMTGITDAMVAGAPSFAQLADEIGSRLAGRLFVAHNARFDYGFLKSEMQQAGVAFEPPVLCTVRLSRRLWPEHRSHGLDAIIARHGLQVADRHRALADARLIWDFVQDAYRKVPAARIEEAVRALVRAPGGDHVPAVGIEAAPDAPGVYRLYSAAGTLLTVGKAARLRGALFQAFARSASGAGGATGRRVLPASADWIETAGPLDSALTALRVSRAEVPTRTRVPIGADRAWTLVVGDESGDGRAFVTRTTADRIDPAALERHVGLFASESAARDALRAAVVSAGACPARAGLAAFEDGERCAACDAANCPVGAPASRRLAHDARLLAALAPMRLAPWPFRGRIGWRESDPGRERFAVHVFDHWQWIGTAASEPELASLADAERPAGIDPSVYRLLLRALDDRDAAGRLIELPDGRGDGGG